ncbi:MAG: hypothetical protein CBB60_003180 [Armatimonadetes bacterium Cent15-Ar3]|nr:MAG: hypothetical protein CBB60_003180 [Armatimonadetes bacterium Cent15-Ar3]
MAESRKPFLMPTIGWPILMLVIVACVLLVLPSRKQKAAAAARNQLEMKFGQNDPWPKRVLSQAVILPVDHEPYPIERFLIWAPKDQTAGTLAKIQDGFPEIGVKNVPTGYGVYEPIPAGVIFAPSMGAPDLYNLALVALIIDKRPKADRRVILELVTSAANNLPKTSIRLKDILAKATPAEISAAQKSIAVNTPLVDEAAMDYQVVRSRSGESWAAVGPMMWELTAALRDAGYFDATQPPN